MKYKETERVAETTMKPIVTASNSGNGRRFIDSTSDIRNLIIPLFMINRGIKMLYFAILYH